MYLSGSDLAARAVANAVENGLKEFLKPYPLTEKNKKHRRKTTRMMSRQPRTVTLPILGLLCLLPILSGCGGGGGSSSASSGGTVPAPDPALQASITKSDNFTSTVSIDKNDIRVGQSVTVKTVLSNNTKSVLYGEFAGDDYALPTLDPILFKATMVEDSQKHGINEDGSPAMIYSPLLNVPVTLGPGQSISSTRVYTFTRADTYTVAAILKDHFVNDFTIVGPLTVIVH